MEENKKPSVILFDVNETLLDMSPLKEKVNKPAEKVIARWYK